MDETTYGRRTASSSRTVRRTQRTRYPARKNEPQGDRRRLIQLMVSLALFLIVYIGRGVFPTQFEALQKAIHDNIDFAAAFQAFSQSVSDGSPLGESLDALWVRILGGEAAPDEPAPDSVLNAPQSIVLLGQMPGAGREYLSTHGVMEKTGSGKTVDEPLLPAVSAPPETADTQPPTAEPTQPALVTAVAQEYSPEGVKLPSNVSFAFYELGLSQTVDPVSGPVTSTFGYRDSPVNGKYEFHLALDIGAAEGTEVGAFADGVVEYIGESDEFGQYLKITHANNVSSFYAHCSKLLVHKGDTVACGQPVALVGHTGNATGPHLHLTIEKDNIRLDPAYYVGVS